MNIADLQSNARRASTLLKAMSNERRLLILCYLTEGEKSVGELEELVDLSQSALSQHLARLRRDKLVRTRRAAQNIYYSLNGHEAQTIMATLHELFCAPVARKTDEGSPTSAEETSSASA
ncbi:metalloregulator ArsR/SmtB family transcription factor [Azospirillum formosense]|uniref:Metalloregulator ArsR/SmtB family transcription factor n=1 Tax=Azospirillum formosense TaxID=861533 RepID=A0ABX2KT88_9PROT|nr:metalloregulator ArsR/SmtB family transcription factor [Azospirillum formosense]MBY3755091.1 winged helix-turn-helix transcriptional regulator [Azospirillum formosense]NUB18014.1 metalloregulator ArsR/SmtB family transcription factor [Azospirillum formosense]